MSTNLSLTLKPPSSHGAPTRLPRLSQVAVASVSSRAVCLTQPPIELLIFNGLAAPHDDPWHPETLQSGRVMWADRVAEAAVRRRHLGRVAWPVRAALAGSHPSDSAEEA